MTRNSSRLVLLCCLMFLPASLSFSAVVPSIAGAAEPWWHLETASRPTNIQPGSAADAASELTVNATGGTFILTVNPHSPQEQSTAPIAFNASAASVQSALQALPFIGPGDVEVTGGPAATAPLTITFTGALRDQPIAAPAAIAVGLTGGRREAILSDLNPGRSDGEIYINATNIGDSPFVGSGSPVELRDVLPAGLEAIAISGGEPTGSINVYNSIPCDLATLTCTFDGSLAAFNTLELRVLVNVTGSVEAPNEAVVSGGNAAATSLSEPVSISGEATPFAVHRYEMALEEEGGVPATRAGEHPFQFTVNITLNQGRDVNPIFASTPEVVQAGLPKNFSFKLPPGLIGNPLRVPRCTLAQFYHRLEAGSECPASSAVGAIVITVREPKDVGTITIPAPIFNLEPTFGEPARFGFFVLPSYTPVIIDTAVRGGPGTGEEYAITANVQNISQSAANIAATATFWGVPGAASHAAQRGWGCLYQQAGFVRHAPCLANEETDPPVVFSMPTSCATPLVTSVESDSWEDRTFADFSGSFSPSGDLEGCNQVPFSPGIHAEPTTRSAASPSGFDFNLSFYDEGLTNAGGLVQSQLNKTVVTLPEGFTIDPSAGVGLVGCTPADYARETLSSPPGTGCPNESKLGTVEVETPLLSQKLTGNIFIAQPYENPFPEPAAGHPNGTLVALYIVIKNPETGLMIKLPGKVTPNPLTGQLVTAFEGNPQFPVSHFDFHFREGAQAPLITAATCGTYETKAELAPWSEPLSPITDSSSFEITSGVGGGACPSGGVPPFHPGIESGTINNNAGTFSPFYLHLTRTDGEQEISGFSTNLPPGLTGDLTGIPYCPETGIEAARHKSGAEEEANPSCPVASQVGHTLVGTGVGAVLAYVPGKLYLAGPFHGAPFSLVSITSAKVGPFDLGTVVLRFGLSINPYTAQVNVSPTSSEPIPTIIDGIVTHVRDIRVYVDRPDFTLNPTSCDPMAIGSTLTAHEGASATVSSPFQAASCADLKFQPKFQVTARAAKDTRLDGATLSVKLSYPQAPQGTQANIARVKVELPKGLPSRLTTLRKACTAAQFEADPAGCPAASRIGMAVVRTPILPVPLEGPAIFVSHGGEAFPSLTMVLQGDGVTIDLVGATFISKAGVTSTTFKTTPDTPFSTFELTLPQGEYSALTALGNLCKQKLTMPTEFVAQNGAEIHEGTKVAVAGCGKARLGRHKRKHAHAKHTRKHARRARKG
jgi:hypothetical protein